ncbi:MAG: hypothetical protein LBS74_11115 [Oscillospiraceae bacterium]|jgi:hypothetical protein|nr:hypothetical protein [Oscillospiraceae bacterium]
MFENFKNVNLFIKWLKNNAKKSPTSDSELKPWLEDLENQYCATASPNYELSKFESKDGNPHIYHYAVQSKINPETGNAETTFWL